MRDDRGRRVMLALYRIRQPAVRRATHLEHKYPSKPYEHSATPHAAHRRCRGEDSTPQSQHALPHDDPRQRRTHRSDPGPLRRARRPARGSPDHSPVRRWCVVVRREEAARLARDRGQAGPLDTDSDQPACQPVHQGPTRHLQRPGSREPTRWPPSRSSTPPTRPSPAAPTTPISPCWTRCPPGTQPR